MSSVDNISSLEEQLAPTAYLGKGMAWPPRPDPQTGDFKKAEAEDSISQCLMHLISTSLGEISPMQDYGTRVDELLFAVGVGSFVQAVASSIMEAIELHERRVRVLEITPTLADNSAGTKTVTISIQYRVVATGNIDNIVVRPPGQGNA